MVSASLFLFGGNWTVNLNWSDRNDSTASSKIGVGLSSVLTRMFSMSCVRSAAVTTSSFTCLAVIGSDWIAAMAQRRTILHSVSKEVSGSTSAALSALVSRSRLAGGTDSMNTIAT